MTRGREMPVNSKVRRRLFQDDPPEPYPEWDSHDHLSKVIKTEYIARTIDNHLILQGMKWNFDFQAERSLRGCLQWYRKGNSDEWVMMEPTGRSIYMRKRSREPMSGLKFTYEEERRAGRKKRRLSPHTVALRRGFFTDGRVQNMAVSQAEDENFTNEFNDDPPPEYSSVRGFDRPPWYTEDETEDDEESYGYEGYEKKDEPKQNQEKLEVPSNETSKNIENNNEIGAIDGDGDMADVGSTDGLADHLRLAGPYPPKIRDDCFPDISLSIEVDKDNNDNDKPLISEEKFQKLHISDEQSNEKQQTGEMENDMINYDQDDIRDNEEEHDMKKYEKEQTDMENNAKETNEMKDKNEATPKNEKKKDIAKQKKGKAKARNGKAKKKLHNSRY